MLPVDGLSLNPGHRERTAAYRISVTRDGEKRRHPQGLSSSVSTASGGALARRLALGGTSDGVCSLAPRTAREVQRGARKGMQRHSLLDCLSPLLAPGG